MKFYVTAILAIFTIAGSVRAQSSLLNSYYGIKNALVNADAGGASASAAEFIKAADSIDNFALRKKVVAGAKGIAATKDLSKQRDYFASFSQDFYALVKAVKLSDQPIYRMYCPMKKTTWFSAARNIENPYYGQAMLTCGSITESINP